MTPVRFLTSNPDKAREVKGILMDLGVEVEAIMLELPEIQSYNLEEIAATTALEGLKRVGAPLMVEDAGLFIDALNGFPGPYSAYVHRTIANRGTLKLMGDIKDRGAIFRSAVAYHGETLHIFVGEVRGTIAHQERGAGWGFDPIFIPQGYELTYAELGREEKNRVSHRRRALEKFAAYLRSVRGQ